MEDIDERTSGNVFPSNPLTAEFLLNVIRSHKGNSTRLDLTNKRFTEVDQLAIENDEDNAYVTTVVELALYSNFIEKVHPNAFVSFSSLTILHLSANELTSIPDLRSARGCRELYLSSNKITKIENLEALPDLEVLDLRANKIKQVENLSANVKLKRLSISCNVIEKIEDLPNLPELLFLGLYGNRIASLDYFLTALPRCAPNLDTLMIEGNPVFHTASIVAVRSQLASSLPQLHWVDGHYISRQSENKTASQK